MLVAAFLKQIRWRVKMNTSRLCLMGLSVFLTACAGLKPQDVANPSELTIDNAMASIGRRFYNMHQELAGQYTGDDPEKRAKNPVLAPAEQEAKRLKLGLWPVR
jgi:hypothetical protein